MTKYSLIISTKLSKRSSKSRYYNYILSCTLTLLSIKCLRVKLFQWKIYYLNRRLKKNAISCGDLKYKNLGHKNSQLWKKTEKRKPWTIMRWVSEKPLNLKINGKRKTRSLDIMTGKKTSQFREEWEKKTGKKDQMTKEKIS